MFEAIRSIATEYLRTHEVSLHKDPAKGYGARERQVAATLNRRSSGAAVVTVGNKARALARRDAPDTPATPEFRELLKEATSREAGPPIDLLGRAVQASAEPFVSFGNAASQKHVVPYEALRFAAASQDPSFASDPPLKAFAGLPLPLLGDEALSIYEQAGADDEESPLRPSERASEPFGREVPFDLQQPHPDEDVERSRGAREAAATETHSAAREHQTRAVSREARAERVDVRHARTEAADREQAVAEDVKAEQARAEDVKAEQTRAEDVKAEREAALEAEAAPAGAWWGEAES